MILVLALQAAMAGASTWLPIAQWASTAPQALALCIRAPSEATLRRVLSAIDITVIAAALTWWITGRRDVLAAAAPPARPAPTVAACWPSTARRCAARPTRRASRRS